MLASSILITFHSFIIRNISPKNSSSYISLFLCFLFLRLRSPLQPKTVRKLLMVVLIGFDGLDIGCDDGVGPAAFSFSFAMELASVVSGST